MATFDLAFHTRLDNVAVLQTFVSSGLQVGDSVVIAGAMHGFNGTHTVISTESAEFLGQDEEGNLLFDYGVIIENQFIFRDVAADITRDVATGTVTFTPSVSWITNADVVSWLGIEVATANDTAFITSCVSASNFWCWNKRRNSGYTDSQTTVPNGSVKLGTVMYAATLYRERGTSGDQYGAFTGMGTLPMPVTLSRIMQLLGCSRATVA